MEALTKIVIIIVLIVLIIYLIRRNKEKMTVSPQARKIHKKAEELFKEKGPDISYNIYKDNIPDADPVQYSDIRNLYKTGNFSPEAVQKVI